MSVNKISKTVDNLINIIESSDEWKQDTSYNNNITISNNKSIKVCMHIYIIYRTILSGKF